MNAKHQIEEMHLSKHLKKHKHFAYPEYSPEDDIVICPWCYNATVYSFSLPNRCNVCSREITDADLLSSFED
ncbi:MAG: hypothetical protein U5K00_05050 [Melioribacteraceae bacterium]|nr:hypothetical protein [Melioribacteraceae bacterium]